MQFRIKKVSPDDVPLDSDDEMVKNEFELTEDVHKEQVDVCFENTFYFGEYLIKVR
ncbi:hypothetical protein SPONN_1433 [uncultured Candidatus Thioglobus sp.]|nr:hypothetical protein SPONN_1433 [uncultured Candidatus Thioglobus sp.]